MYRCKRVWSSGKELDRSEPWGAPLARLQCRDGVVAEANPQRQLVLRQPGRSPQAKKQRAERRWVSLGRVRRVLYGGSPSPLSRVV